MINQAFNVNAFRITGKLELQTAADKYAQAEAEYRNLETQGKIKSKNKKKK